MLIFDPNINFMLFKEIKMKKIIIICVVFIFLFELWGKGNKDNLTIVGDNATWYNISPEVAKKKLQNTIIFVNYFKTWQISSSNSGAFLNLISKTFSNDTFFVMSVSIEAPEKVKEYVEKNHITYPVAAGSTTLFSEEIPHIFLIKNGKVDKDAPLKGFDFKYLWNQIDLAERTKIEDTSSNYERDYKKWRQTKSLKYYNFFKQLYKNSINALKKSIPKMIEKQKYEDIYSSLNSSEKIAFDKTFVIDEYQKNYFFKDDIDKDDKNAVINIMIHHGIIGIVEDLLSVVTEGMFYLVGDQKRGIDSIFFSDVITRKEKKFYKFLKKSSTDIVMITEVNIDKYF